MKQADVQKLIDDYESKIWWLNSKIRDLQSKLKSKQMYIADLTQWIGYSYYMWLRPIIKQGSFDYTRVHRYIDDDTKVNDELGEILTECEK